MEQSVPKRRHIKFRRRGITQKKAYKIIKYLRRFFFVSGFSFETGVLFHLSECARFVLEYVGFLVSSRNYSSIERWGERPGQATLPTKNHACGEFVSQACNCFTFCVFLWHGFAAIVAQHRRLQRPFLTSPALLRLVLNIRWLQSCRLPTTVRISKNRNFTPYGDFRNP
jgi:hypothetical protein